MGVKVRENVKGSGEYYIHINYKGKRKAKKVGRKQEAEKIAKKINAKLVLGEFHMDDERKTDTPTFGVYVVTWRADHVDGILADSTHERYGHVIDRDLIPTLGNKKVDEIEPKDIRNLFSKLTKQGRTSKSISLTRTVLGSCLNEAVVDGLIKENPVKLIKQNRKRVKGGTVRDTGGKRIHPFNEAEVATYIESAMAYSPGMYGPMFLCGFRTGLRLGELICIEWNDIDWVNKTISIYKSYRKGVLNDRTKTDVDRKVDISDQLYSVLMTMKNNRDGQTKKNGSPGKQNGVVFDYRGGYRAQNTVRKAFKLILEKANLPKIRVHDMRHTYASILISKGASLIYIKEQLGHSSIKTTSDIYAHLIPGSQRNTINLLDSPTT